jgi:hypothetical protein
MKFKTGVTDRNSLKFLLNALGSEALQSKDVAIQGRIVKWLEQQSSPQLYETIRKTSHAR